MTINLVKTHKDYNHYEVTLYDDKIQTLVTHCPSMVESWLFETQRIHRRRLHHLIVGLDVEWRPNKSRDSDNPIATLQLCVGHRCLIFQIIHSPSIPLSLFTFLDNASYTFMGVNIEKDVEKLVKHCEIRVVNVVDLRDLVVERLSKAGLKTLAREVLGMEVEKRGRVSWSNWDEKCLTLDQVGYACVDAFLSFEIGRSLDASGDVGFWGGLGVVFENLRFGLYFIVILFIFFLLGIGCCEN